MTYKETLDYLYHQLPMFQRQGPVAFKKDLGNIKELCELIGSPDQNQKFIHLAGTNGKGSTSHILASILQEHGYSVGLYTSPHYKDFRERIKINADFITKRQVSYFVNIYKDHFDRIQPSFFEITVAMAFWYFKRKKVDYAIIETGLGGRLDSTNIIQPLLSIITNIGLDHQNMLGNTLELIAGEKAGIIKAETPVLIGEHQSKISKVFKAKAKQENAPLKYAKELVKVEWEKTAKDMPFSPKNNSLNIEFKKELSVKGKTRSGKYTTDLSGEYQAKNIQTAIAGYLELEALGELKFSQAKLKKALKNVSQNTYFIGRWMILGNDPLCIADSAHNVDGLKIVMKAIKQIPHEKLHFVFGTVNDKDVSKVLKLLPKKAEYYFAKANIPRGMKAADLVIKAKKFGLKGIARSSVKIAFASAKFAATKNDLVYVGGSIFVVAEVL